MNITESEILIGVFKVTELLDLFIVIFLNEGVDDPKLLIDCDEEPSIITFPPLPPNSIVVMDNASFHKNSLIKEVIHQAGHILEYLPP